MVFLDMDCDWISIYVDIFFKIEVNLFRKKVMLVFGGEIFWVKFNFMFRN